MSAQAMPEACLLCGASPLDMLDEEAARCPHCQLLHNLKAEDLLYVDGGGQAVPDSTKMRWRLVNARRRLNLIRPFFNGHDLLIDIGCGSGEMLVAGHEAALEVTGFDTNRPLIRYIREVLGFPVFENHFNPAQLDVSTASRKKIFTLSHVLEHLARPLDLVLEIAQAMAAGDLLYIEVPLATGRSFQEQGYCWTLWAAEHRALYTPQALQYIAERAELRALSSGTRIFARGSHSSRMRIRLFRDSPWRALVHLMTKPSNLSLADMMVADYGFIILLKA